MSPETLLAGRYRMRRRMATGGMGEVWLAHDEALGRDVAVKVLRVGADIDPTAVERFSLEARALAALQHPNIVSIFDSGTATGTAFIVMELLTGPTLAQHVAERGPLPEPEAVRLATQVAAGLDAAHRAGVIHRDIKPSNLMFTSSGALKILDFGIARLSQATTGGLTATNAVIGSASYLAPEQAAGGTVDERSDLYALGCVLMTMLAGRPPFTADHPMAILHQQVHDEPPRLRELRPQVSPALDGLVQRLLAKRPDARPASAGDVEAELAAIASAALPDPALQTTLALPAPDGATQVADPVGPAATRAYPTAVASELARPAGAASRAPSGRRQRWLIAAGVLAAAVLVALVSLALVDRSRDDTSAPPAGSPSATPAASSPAPTASRQVTPTPEPSATSRPATPLEQVRAAVVAAVADGQLDPKRADDLLDRVDALADDANDGKKKGRQPAENLARYLSRLVERGELTEAGRSRIQAALDRL